MFWYDIVFLDPFSHHRGYNVQYGLVLRRFVLRQFTFTTFVESDRAPPTYGAVLSHIKHPFSTLCTSSSFPVHMRFFFFYFTYFF